MIDRIIVEYLKSNKRLVVPDLGTFIRKDGGQTVFVEFMKKDDGVLSAFMAESNGSSVEAAMAEITLYAANVKRAVTANGEYPIPGLGRIYKTPEGALELDHAAAGRPPVEKPAAAPAETKQDPARQNTAPEPDVQEKSPRAERVAADKLFGAPTSANKEGSPSPKAAFNQPRTSDASAQTMNFGQARPGARSAGAARPTPAQNPQQRPPGPRPAAPAPKRKKADTVMIVAIVAAVVAVIALGFSVYVNNGPAKNLKSTNYIEQQTTAPAPEDAVTDSVDNKN